MITPIQRNIQREIGKNGNRVKEKGA